MRDGRATHSSGVARRARTLGIALVLATPWWQLSAHAANPTFIVRYRSASNVYLDGGKAEGLNLGDRLGVMVGTETVAELEVIFIAEGSASCRVVSEKRSVRAGDAVTLLRRGEAPPEAPTDETKGVGAPVAPAAPTLVAKAPPAKPWARVRGGASVGLYKVWDTEGAFGFEQRLGRVDLSLFEIGGQPLSFNTRFRSRRDARSASLSSSRFDKRNDLYEASLRYEPPKDDIAFEVGRLGSSRFTSIGYLDGALLRVRLRSPIQLGGFFGRRADVDGLGIEGTGQKYGAFLRVSPRNPYSASYDVTLAVIREFAQADVSREYLGLETRFGSGKVSVFGRSEVDLNRGWRRDVADQDYQLSNLSVATNMRFSPSASAVISYDSRRNYRDYYTRNVPEQIFDDLLHQGLRSSVYFGRGYGLNVTAGFGLRLRERDTPNSYSYNGGIRHGNLFKKDISIGADFNAFQNVATDGYLVTAQTGKRFRRGHQFDLSYGRSLYRVKTTGQQRRTEYLRFSGRGDLGRHVYLLADVEYDRGDDLRGPRGFFEAGYQF
jgi:hypothetical protein